jgi:hypothetical protein
VRAVSDPGAGAASPPAAASFRLALAYFAVVFTFAFLTGMARVLVLEPWLGATAALLLEVPVIVAASWMVARLLLLRRPLTLPQRASMGATAFALTMASEAALSWLMRGQSVAEWAGSLTTDLGLVGFAGQALFGLMPMLVGRGRTRLSTGG